MKNDSALSLPAGLGHVPPERWAWGNVAYPSQDIQRGQGDPSLALPRASPIRVRRHPDPRMVALTLIPFSLEVWAERNTPFCCCPPALQIPFMKTTMGRNWCDNCGGVILRGWQAREGPAP